MSTSDTSRMEVYEEYGYRISILDLGDDLTKIRFLSRISLGEYFIEIGIGATPKKSVFNLIYSLKKATEIAEKIYDRMS